MVNPEQVSPNQALSAEQLSLAVLDFIDDTTRFYQNSLIEAFRFGIKVPASNHKALSESIAAVNRCLKEIGGIKHYFESDGVTHDGTFTEWLGFDPDTGDGTHVWSFRSGGVAPAVSVSLLPLVVDEMRTKLLA